MKANDVTDAAIVRFPDPIRRRRPGSLVASLMVMTGVMTWAAAAEARGKLIDLHGALLAGGMTGGGSGSTDLFRQTRGASLGGELGMRLLVIDLSIRFLQMLNPEGHHGTVLSALIGPSVEIPVKGGGTDPFGKPRLPQVVIRPGVAAGFGFGTLGPVDPPLSNDQLAGKGVLIMGRFAVERMYGPIVGLGGEIQGGYHYFFGANTPINGQDHSSGWQVGAFATLAVHFGI